jgi:hypothetical protein
VCRVGWLAGCVVGGWVWFVFLLDLVSDLHLIDGNVRLA